MKIQYKHQKFQTDAAKAVVDVFVGQPNLTPTYKIDEGRGQLSLLNDTGYSNQKIVSSLNDEIILKNIQQIQKNNHIQPSSKLEGRDNGYNLTIEMETGVGKTYTYINTMYELNEAYGWSKFIIVVPSIAIREGVYKTFQMTQEHFAETYRKKIRFFIYNSAQLTDIDHFASDSSINVMIINAQAFNAKGKDARRIYMKLDEFQSRRPIDIIAKTNPILIIDEPQSVEGKQTKERLKEFHPLFTLRYSATHKSDSIYNMIYRLDAQDAYNKRLVKKIAVTGVTATGSTATNSYLYLEGINLSSKDPTATLYFEVKMTNAAPKIQRHIVKVGDNLYDYSNELEEYKNNFIIINIDGRDNSVEFMNGLKIYAGDVIGAVDEDQLRRIQIRETILAHIKKEGQLFSKQIKVLSLFFIDEVANYREYDENGQTSNGKYAKMFEEEYTKIIKVLKLDEKEDEYGKYLKSINVSKTHAGYFSVDGKGKMVNSKIGRKETTSDDVSAYELIMKNKELLLDRDPQKSPVRFIFSHSALKEGWDNPNVFQICTLKQSNSDVRKRQEVGRGLRLCVNQDGERMDADVLGDDVHNINVLTVIASESYDSFAKGLQNEISDGIADRPHSVTAELFINKVIKDNKGNEHIIDEKIAETIIKHMNKKDYIDDNDFLTDKYYQDKESGNIEVPEIIADSASSFIEILDSVYNPRSIQIENTRSNNVELHVDDDKLAMNEFKNLWSKINQKSFYEVEFETEELIKNAIDSLNTKLTVSKIYFLVESGVMNNIESKEILRAGNAFTKDATSRHGITIKANDNVKYDLIGKLVDKTGLTRKTIIAILKGIEEEVFNKFKDNPEEFIEKSASLINDETATTIIEHITYNALDEHYSMDIFTDSSMRGTLGVNAMKAKKHLFDHLVYDSTNEQNFAKELDISEEVAVYVKLPKSFYISTPVGKYNPDWAIAFYEGKVKHIYFVAETKGSMNSMELRLIEKSKIHCAKEHFKAISRDDVVYDVVDSYKALMDKVMK